MGLKARKKQEIQQNRDALHREYQKICCILRDMCGPNIWEMPPEQEQNLYQILKAFDGTDFDIGRAASEGRFYSEYYILGERFFIGRHSGFEASRYFAMQGPGSLLMLTIDLEEKIDLSKYKGGKMGALLQERYGDEKLDWLQKNVSRIFRVPCIVTEVSSIGDVMEEEELQRQIYRFGCSGSSENRRIYVNKSPRISWYSIVDFSVDITGGKESS